jgi:phage terminase Nu1 subunit (DNA packaging protein)
MKRTEKVAFTPSKFASLIGADRHEITRKLTEINASPSASDGRGDEYSLKDLVAAHMGGDIRREQLRRTKEEADRLALANARSRGELVEIAAVKKLGEKVMIAIRNRVLNMPLTDEEKDRCLIELMELGKLDWSREG